MKPCPTTPALTVPDSVVNDIMEALILRGFDVRGRRRDREGVPLLTAAGDWTNKLAVEEAAKVGARFPAVVIAVVRKGGTGDLEFSMRVKA